jgi:hypothetical protein
MRLNLGRLLQMTSKIDKNIMKKLIGLGIDVAISNTSKPKNKKEIRTIVIKGKEIKEVAIKDKYGDTYWEQMEEIEELEEGQEKIKETEDATIKKSSLLYNNVYILKYYYHTNTVIINKKVILMNCIRNSLLCFENKCIKTSDKYNLIKLLYQIRDDDIITNKVFDEFKELKFIIYSKLSERQKNFRDDIDRLKKELIKFKLSLTWIDNLIQTHTITDTINNDEFIKCYKTGLNARASSFKAFFILFVNKYNIGPYDPYGSNVRVMIEAFPEFKVVKEILNYFENQFDTKKEIYMAKLESLMITPNFELYDFKFKKSFFKNLFNKDYRDIKVKIEKNIFEINKQIPLFINNVQIGNNVEAKMSYLSLLFQSDQLVENFAFELYPIYNSVSNSTFITTDFEKDIIQVQKIKNYYKSIISSFTQRYSKIIYN